AVEHTGTRDVIGELAVAIQRTIARAQHRLPAGHRVKGEFVADHVTLRLPDRAWLAHQLELQLENDPVVPVGRAQRRGVQPGPDAAAASANRAVHFGFPARHDHQPAGSGLDSAIHGDRLTTTQASGLDHGLDFEELFTGAIAVGSRQWDLVGDLRVVEVVDTV